MNGIAPAAAEPLGTLLWIGDRNRQPFRAAYQFSDAHVSGLAYRRDLTDAIDRPAPLVKTIVMCVENDSSKNVHRFDELRDRHADAVALLLLGPLCGGARPSIAQRFASETIFWHHWQSRLPRFLSGCGVTEAKPQPARSIAVVANRFANASALMEIASTRRVPTMWCRPNQLGSVTNIDQFWWDDSAACLRDLPSLIASAQDPNRRSKHATHVWIANDLSPQKSSRALHCGVDTVIAKPGDLSILFSVAGEVGQARQRAVA